MRHGGAMPEILFYVFAGTAVGGAVGVVLQRNPVGSLLFMVGTLASIAGIFVLLEAQFLAAIQLMVYAGAIMVLFLFVIMLLNLGHDYRADLKRGLGAFLAFAVTGALGGLLVGQLGGVGENPLYEYLPGPGELDRVFAADGIVGAIARPLFTDYVVPFELVGILLLVALIGAVALAKKGG
ncbi:MAG: NADH-quinone oxidoreductase subunit J [Gemmatimonadetes bacterium]|nr:NADH-quinone oxidoreductase subunit J [Gemmatimonadota bacterium]